MDKNSNRTIDGLAPRGFTAVGSVNRRRTAAHPPKKPSTRRVGELPRKTTEKAVIKKTPTKQDVPKFEGISKNTIERERTKLKATEDFLKPISSLNFDLSSDDLRSDDNYRNPGKKQHRKLALKIFGAVSGVLILCLVGLFIWSNGLISKITDGESGLLDLLGAGAELRTDSRGRTNVLAFGTSGYEMSGSGHDGAELTDSIMIISLDKASKDVAMISLPRDLYVGNTCTDTGKINEVYWCSNQNGNSEKSGAEALINTVESMVGIDIQYRVHVDWGALMQIVDGIGGITVTLDNDVDDPDYTEISIRAGVPTQLDGIHAVGLARARHGTIGGDFSRSENQQKILSAIQAKIVGEKISLTTAINLINAAGDNIRMNFSVDELKTVFALAHDISLGSMRQIPLIDFEDYSKSYITTSDINGVSYVIPSEGIGQYDAIKTYVAKMLSADATSRENAKILVLNGSGTPGVAATERGALEDAGYTVVNIGDAPDGYHFSDAYTVYDVTDKNPGTKSGLAVKYHLTVRGASELPEGINTDGVDFVVIVGGDYVVPE